MKSRSRLGGVVLLLAILAGLIPAAGGAGPRGSGLGLAAPVAEAGELEDAQKKLNEIQKLIEQKQAEFDRLSSQEKSVVKDINNIEKQIDALERDLNDLQNRLTQAERAIAITEADIADAQARLDVRNGLMMKRIRALDEVGSVSYLEVILGSRSFSDFLARFELLRQVLAADVTLFKEVKEEKRQLEAKKAYLEEQKATLSDLKGQTAARKASVEEKQEAREALLAQLREDKKAIAAALDELEKTSKQLQDYIYQIQLAAGRAGGVPAFIWPTAGPISSRFGPRFHPILKVYKDHTGIDIAAPAGQTIKAAASGIVILAGWAGGYGQCVIIDHGGYYSSLYGHMSWIGVKAGQEVAQGVEIGHVGSTGYSTGPHLHFEVRYKGEPVNPVPLLPPR